MTLSHQQQLFFQASKIDKKWLEEAENINWKFYFQEDKLYLALPIKIPNFTSSGIEMLETNTDNFPFLDLVFKKTSKVEINQDFIFLYFDLDKKTLNEIKEVEGEFDISGNFYNHENQKNLVENEITMLDASLQSVKSNIEILENQIKEKKELLKQLEQRNEKIKKCTL